MMFSENDQMYDVVLRNAYCANELTYLRFKVI